VIRWRPVAALLLLSGCVAGPDYRIPDKAMVRSPPANGPFDSGANRAFVQVPLPDGWWQLFRNPRLDRLVTEALAANADLRAADANFRQSEAAVLIARSARTVTTDISAGAALARPSGTGASLPGTVGYDLGFAVGYPLDLAGQIRRGIEAARADAETVLAARDNVRVVVAAGTARAYASICSANWTLAANRRVTATLRQTLEVTGRLQRGGRATAFDVTRARAAVEQSEAAIPAILAARQAAVYQLAALLGRAAEAYPRDVVDCTRPPLVGRPLPIGDGAALLRRRPDIRQAERSLAAATARIGVATADLYPQVSLGG
jgi:NodT family efflux transporter outer membrane factor (OMF) lipoprotein